MPPFNVPIQVIVSNLPAIQVPVPNVPPNIAVIPSQQGSRFIDNGWLYTPDSMQLGHF